MESYRIADALEEIWTLLRRSNKYIDETTPWILAKDTVQQERLGTILYNLIESIRIAGVLLKSFIPEMSEQILSQINITSEGRTFESLKGFNGSVPGTLIGAIDVLFPRIDEAKKLVEVERLKAKYREEYHS